ncbi:glycosyltransferase [Agilicoccus flavus]|uniref:glycosyltransferase n=1 Tax=Agilicoccus flavus TaxID=2775968 RepID=UPI0027DA677A|nr:glycosyltransferase [Agilicoccus flavus]
MSPSAARPPVRRVAVVVPARDEQTLLGACLASVRHAEASLRRTRPGVDVDVVVALDRCTDASADVAAAHRVRTRLCDHGCVGGARHEGVVAAIRHAVDAGIDPGRLWIAGTDADSVVPTDWLTTQVELADAGHDVLVGTVEPHGLEPALARAWREAHDLREGHPHVHGANLGLRASTYLAAGGFRPLAVHEDVDLLGRARSTGAACLSTDRTRVATSSRLHGRAPDGFAAYLADLARLAARATAATTAPAENAAGRRAQA